MCYTQSASFFLSMANFAVALHEHKCFGCHQYSLGIAYFGLMELLQFFQHFWLAVPEDGYQMCKDPVNQALTFLGVLHICFQPLFTNMLIMCHQSRFDIRDRIESQSIKKLCIWGGLWLLFACSYPLVYPDDPNWAPPATEDCPNYDWLREGYDPYMQETTPNIPGRPCTYQSPSKYGHLAWVFPMYQGTYFVPTTSLHFFLMFAPYLWVQPHRPLLPCLPLVLFLTGPYLTAYYLTPSLNEQASIWCFFSVFQTILMVFVYRLRGETEQVIPDHLIVEGTYGEEPLVYRRVKMTSGKSLLDYKSLVSSNSDSEESVIDAKET